MALACGGSSGSSTAAEPERQGEEGSALEPNAPSSSQPERQWRLPAGGVAVEAVPDGSSLQVEDAFGNLWLDGCYGVFVVHERGIQRYRYLDTPWLRGGVQVTADAQGRIWLESDGLFLLEAGEMREIPLPESVRPWQLAFGSDGVAWGVAFDQSRLTHLPVSRRRSGLRLSGAVGLRRLAPAEVVPLDRGLPGEHA